MRLHARKRFRTLHGHSASGFSGAVRRLNEVDPYYEFAYSVTGETTTVKAHPRYPDAPRDRPLQVTATLRFDDSLASQAVQSALADFMTYGTRVVIPGVHVEGLVVEAQAGTTAAGRRA